MKILNCDIPDGYVEKWVHWFAPDVQPLVDLVGGAPADERLTSELQNTFELYGPQRNRFSWLTEAEFFALSKAERAAIVRGQFDAKREQVPSVRGFADLVDPAATKAQADGHRFLWWPSNLPADPVPIFNRVLSDGRPASRHDEVPAAIWRDCGRLLPAAHDLAGTWPATGESNCFGTTMAVAGVEGAAQDYVVREPFEAWLAASTRPGGRPEDPGCVLVWRNTDGEVEHSAVTLGGGWAFHKPNQGWMTPRVVLEVRELMMASRFAGGRVTRRQLI